VNQLSSSNSGLPSSIRPAIQIQLLIFKHLQTSSNLYKTLHTSTNLFNHSQSIAFLRKVEQIFTSSNSSKIYKSHVNPLGLLLPPDRDVNAPAVRDVDAPAQISNVFWIPKTFQRFLDVEG
jgi:hypothetical protein